MPLMCIQYSEHLPNKQRLKNFILNAHEQIALLVQSDVAKFRTRIISVDDFVSGDGTNDERQAVFAIDFRMLSGRSEEVKKAVGTYLLQEAKGTFQQGVERIQVSIQIEIGEFKRDHYHQND